MIKHPNSSERPEINTIFVVDDEENWSYLTKRTLQKSGVGKHIITASNGLEAINELQARVANQESMPELIFLDIKMPVMDGFEFLEEISRSAVLNFDQTKVYIYSSSFHPKDRERASHYPISGFITKPLTQEILTEIVNSA